ncbi:Zn-dependent protease with chaperone function [Andreprevotia lacus DSM 23236]|jgi:Zn-dependent protease with chaperone function|uniref:Zn-dependent protease with chaperone function n=1 Tax=Andreprevotia lacus DSM 23236 TaxID=1121001 RepID=A0A1W1X8Q4_9NEIS|nr:M48 family metallopeptidase [Andreprevotia lacus]SMC20197.1 Zn-dependent protease with chaperone function [Andreprevotia lacus DSM 23236]
MKQLKDRLKLLALVLGVPLLLLLWGGWQWTRPQLNMMHTKDVPLQEWATGEFYQHSLPPLLAGATALLGALALLFGILGLVRIRAAGRRAQQSRELLLSNFRAVVGWLPWLLLGHLLTTLLALACGLSFELLPVAPLLVSGDVDPRLALVAGLVLAMLLWMAGHAVVGIIQATRRAYASTPLSLHGKAVDATQAPTLWRLVQGLAAKTGATAPDAIVVGLDEGFFVTEQPVQLNDDAQPLAARRVLYLPLPYMAWLSLHETAAIIGHELAHFTGADTEYSLHFAPIYTRAVNQLDVVEEMGGDKDDGVTYWLTAPVRMLNIYFLDAFHAAVQHWSRERELAADALGAQMVNTQAAASALLRSGTLAPHVGAALADYHDRPDQAVGGMLDLLQRRIALHGLGDPRAALEAELAHPFDSHPTTQQRLDALGVAIDDALLQRACAAQPSSTLHDLGLAGQAGGDITQTVESAYADAANAGLEGRRRELTELAAKGATPLPCFERMALARLGLVMFTAFFWWWASQIWGRESLALSSRLIYVAVLFVAGVLPLWFLFVVHRRSKLPVMTFDKDGLHSRGLAAVVPWTAIVDFDLEVREVYGTTHHLLKLALAEGHVAPKTRRLNNVRYRKKEHELLLAAQGLRGMKSQAFYDAFIEYWQAGHARVELARLGA